jgi:hypothetical protein
MRIQPYILEKATKYYTANEKVLIDALYDAREYINVNAYAGCPNACLYLEKLDKALTHVEGENR